MIILAIDPGNELSALVWYDVRLQRVAHKMKVANEIAVRLVLVDKDAGHLAIEMAESFGAKVWGQVFTTVLWTGRFVQAWDRPFTLVTRREVKLHLCNSARAKDAQIRNCLIDRWGGKAVAIGTKSKPGPLHGITADCWQALAIGVTYADEHSVALEVAA